MTDNAQNDDLIMTLVELALARSPDEREAYLRTECSGNPQLFQQVWDYVQWDQRMQGFLSEPLISLPPCERPFEPGELLENRFRIVREVAQGGMGIVYEAIDEKLERRIAIKCAKSGFGPRLPPEVRNATEISHPNVCKIFEIHTASTPDGEIDFLTMEFLEGETLDERLREAAMPEPEARAIGQQLCAGLAEAHRNHVIHGDLKTNNVILTSGADGTLRAVITDFGLASRPESTSKPEEMRGTPDYMAPELWKGEKPSTASDIYALGVILYELFSGRRPYPPEVLLQERLTRKVPPVHPKWDGVLARCLDPDPARRFRNAEEIAQAFSPPSPRRWFLQAAAAVVVAAAAGAVTYQRGVPGESGLLAVIPFVNASHTPESEYLSDGVSEGLINALVHLPDLKVIARSSSFKFKGANIDVHKAARMLGAQLVVTGRVAEMGGRLRITTELVNGADGMQIWGAQYNCALSDLPSIQAEISRQIAERMRSKLTPSERLKLAKARQVNPEAYELLLRGRYQMRLYTPESRQRAIGYFQQALAVDPGFSLVHAELAAAYRVLSGSGILDAAEALPQAEAEARRALAADPDLAEAHAALAGIKRDRWDWTGAEREYRAALALSPNLVIARTGLAICLSVTGKYDAAIAEIQHSRELDPIGLPTAVDVAAVYYNTRHYDQAAEALERAASLDPSSPTPWMWMGIVKGGSGSSAEAVAAFEKAILLGDSTGATQCLYAHSLARSGGRHQALQILDKLRRSQVFVPPSALAFIYTGLNDKESAIHTLQTAYATRDPLLQYMKVESHYDILKNDPRFQDLAARIGLPQ